MNRALLLPAVLAVALFAAPAMADDKKFEDFDKVVKPSKEYDGLFKLYHKDDTLFAEIREDQFNKSFLAPTALARGMGNGGLTLNFDEQWVLSFRRVGDKVQVVRRNVRFKAKADSPAAKAVETTYADSVLMALPIRTINHHNNAVVVDLNELFFHDFAGLELGNPDPDRTRWLKIKTFPKNIELDVETTFGRGGGDAVIDPRGNTVVVHYGLVEMPEGFTARIADDRVGHFVSAVKDFSGDNNDTSFVRYVNRWRLERADGSAWKEGGKLVPPKKKIVFWIEKTVPDEYRAAVREGILEWNKAFEKIGFRDAIEVRQQENEDFEPEDINYATFRWIASDAGFAMGPSRANPVTGEIIDADIIFDASMVRFYQTERTVFTPPGQTADSEGPASRILADRLGLGLTAAHGWNDRAGKADPRSKAARLGLCRCGSHMSHELGLAALALAARAEVKPGEKLPDELVQQAVKEVVMHEVGHTLGLRHNFKASTMLPNDKLHDTSITRKQGLVASVMDYTPVNIAPKGVKQGDYFTSTLGPYDYWAIEYAYRPLSGGTDGEVEELHKIAAKGAQPGLDYGTDEDMFGSPDPATNTWDLGADPMRYGMDRMLLAEEMLKGLADRVVDNGEGYQRARRAFTTVLRQFGDGAHLISSHVGGEYMHRDHRGDPAGRDPLVPVKPARQREALKFLQEHVLTDKPFKFPPDVLRKLASDRWAHWGADPGRPDYPLYERIVAVQDLALDHLLTGRTLDRIQNLALQVDKGDEPLTVAEVFRATSDAVWADLPALDKADKPTATSSIVRRNLQRAYLKRLTDAALGRSGGPADAKSLARMHLREAGKRIDAALKADKLDDTVRAHLEEAKETVAKVLNAGLTVGQP